MVNERWIDEHFFLHRSPSHCVVRHQEARLETLSQWLSASAEGRRRALASLVERVRTQDAEIHAWLQISPQSPTGQGPLSGIPFGVKDIIETKGLSTEYGSPIYKGRIGTSDAAIVRLLRDKGSVLFGKTHTTGFAYRQPAPTRNPRDLAHTPGGSSSGSAAAVAAGMVPIAIGTQTGGSTIRPASVLRHHRVQGHVRLDFHRRCTAIRQKPRHAGILHAHSGRYARVLAVDWSAHRPRRRCRVRRARTVARRRGAHGHRDSRKRRAYPPRWHHRPADRHHGVARNFACCPADHHVF